MIIMTNAILTVFRSEDGTEDFAGAKALVSLYCDSNTKKLFYTVFINSDFDEFAATGTGRKRVTKIVNPCNESFSYVQEQLQDLQVLQGCCTDGKNYLITLACAAEGTISVYDVLGNVIGSATTATQYATVWNANANNQKIGQLFVQTGWNFVLHHLTGNFRPLSLQCSSTTCPVISFGDVTQTSIEITWTGTSGNTYYYELLNSSNAVLQAGTTSSGLHKVFTGLTASTAYKIRISAGTASDSSCSVVNRTTSAAPNLFYWDFFTSEPVDVAGASLTQSMSHTPETNIVINPAGTGANKWFLGKFNSSESVFATWYNTTLNSGTIPDSTFENIIVIGSNKYIKSRVAFTLDESQLLTFGR
jgi:hypothetical protein